MKSEKTPIVRLSVLKSGKVLPDGKESNLPEVKKALAKAKLHNGVVWYYRENGKDEPPPHAMEVIKLTTVPTLTAKTVIVSEVNRPMLSRNRFQFLMNFRLHKIKELCYLQTVFIRTLGQL